jgi:16S rRNA (guanine(527)-N(7))-methyltransferase RsmG
MTATLLSQRLKKGAEELSLELSNNQIEQFEEFARLLKQWNQSINLTAIENEEDIANKHFVDSLAYCKGFPEEIQNLSLLDVGSGAGFPGVPLKIAFPEIDLTLVEPSFKRTSFLHLLKGRLGLDMTIVEHKIEKWYSKVPKRFDVIVLRAISGEAVKIEKLLDLLNQGGRIILSKGPVPLLANESNNYRVKKIHLFLESSKLERTLLIYSKT